MAHGSPYRERHDGPSHEPEAQPTARLLGRLREEWSGGPTEFEWGVVGVLLISILGTSLFAWEALVGIPVLVVPLLVLLVAGKPRAVRVFDNAIEADGWLGSSKRIYFEDISAVFQVLAPGRRPSLDIDLVWRCVIEDVHGQKISFADVYSRIGCVTDTFNLLYLRPIYNEAVQTIDDGEVLTFGPVSVSAGCLEVGSHAIDLSELSHVSFSPTLLKFYAHNGIWEEAPIEKVPYPFVLVDVLRHLGLGVEGQGGLQYIEEQRRRE